MVLLAENTQLETVGVICMSSRLGEALSEHVFYRRTSPLASKWGKVIMGLSMVALMDDSCRLP